ncbi:MAG: rhomboid family intramembrane serine protease [Bacteroidales bacterium]|nr:rhomboid family intramembrane serine protease [Bacteroidales bacterium]
MSAFERPNFGSTPPIVKNLIIINVIMLLATFVVDSVLRIDLNSILGLYYFGSEHFRPFQIITHMFMHGGITHIFFNMFALWMFGRVLEQVWGSKRFLLYYFVTGFGAVALHTFVNYIQISNIESAATAMLNTPSPETFSAFVTHYFPGAYNEIYEKFISHWSNSPGNPTYIEEAGEWAKALIQLKMDIPVVGASGAVFGVLLAFGMLFPNTELMLMFIPIPIKAKYFVIGYGVIELFMGVSNFKFDNVAHFAHLGGMLFGFILIKYWNRRKDIFY